MAKKDKKQKQQQKEQERREREEREQGQGVAQHTEEVVENAPAVETVEETHIEPAAEEAHVEPVAEEAAKAAETEAGAKPGAEAAAPGAGVKKKYYYNPAKAKERRDKVMAAAVAGGYIPKKRTGTGTTEKRTSKTGKTYYYTPWNKLSGEQKDARLAQARGRMKDERALARKYKEEHPEEFAKSQGQDQQNT